jgi:hypothetical protein
VTAGRSQREDPVAEADFEAALVSHLHRLATSVPAFRPDLEGLAGRVRRRRAKRRFAAAAVILIVAGTVGGALAYIGRPPITVPVSTGVGPGIVTTTVTTPAAVQSTVAGPGSPGSNGDAEVPLLEVSAPPGQVVVGTTPRPQTSGGTADAWCIALLPGNGRSQQMGTCFPATMTSTTGWLPAVPVTNEHNTGEILALLAMPGSRKDVVTSITVEFEGTSTPVTVLGWAEGIGYAIYADVPGFAGRINVRGDLVARDAAGNEVGRLGALRY